MKDRFRLRSLAVFASAAVLAACLVVAADEPNVTGTWAMTVESSFGTGSPTFTLSQKGEDITGTYKGQLGEAPVTGTLKGNAIAMSFTITVQGRELRLDYVGTVDGDTMTGKVKFGEFGEGKFKGTRKRPTQE
jgi:hypothetical protein